MEQVLLRYNRIPKHLMKGQILEIGSGNFQAQFQCKHKDVFLSRRYTGIDLDPPDYPTFIIKGDVLELDFPANSFDLIIAFEVIEHIPFNLWEELFLKIKSWLRPKGRFIFSTPYNETAKLYDLPSPHIVFGIKKSTLLEFFPFDLKMKVFSHPFFWGTKKEARYWRILRGIKRLITLHPFLRHSLYGVWKK